MLVWMGRAEGTLEPATELDHPAPQSMTEKKPDAQVEPTSTHPLDAERRQLTVMFCDLVGSTALSGQLDPEDLRDVIQAYQSTSGDVIERYNGYIAQHLGDGLMVYFGWPQAHEDDAQRALHVGLGILEAMDELNVRLQQEKGVRLAVRIGIHTGLVVVGEIGKGASQEHLALGETPNLASRIEGVATPDTVAISAATYQLIRGYFVCEDLEVHTFKGVDAPQRVYRVVSTSGLKSRFLAATAMGLTPLVGREEEIALLSQRWAQVQAGEGQAVLIGGEAGIGKSRITQALRELIADAPHLNMHYQCSPYHTHTAFYPITEQIASADDFTHLQDAGEKLDKLETHLKQIGLSVPEVAPLFAAALSIPTGDRYPPLNMTPQRQKERTIDALAERLLAEALQLPVLFIAEDLHWSDPSSLETIGRIIEQLAGARVLIVCTYRPTFEVPWGLDGPITTLSLNRLSRSQTTTLTNAVTADKRLPPDVLEQIVAKSDGVPLFAEELTKHVLESGLLDNQENHDALKGPLPPLAIPATLQDALMAKLDRLSDESKRTVQLASVIGRQFQGRLLEHIAGGRDALDPQLAELQTHALIYRQGRQGFLPEPLYVFRHAVIQDVAYHSLLLRRRKELHSAIGYAIEDLYPERLAEYDTELAHHFTQGEVWSKAMDYSVLAGDRAAAAYANTEAKAHYADALYAVEQMPATPQMGAVARLHAKYGTIHMLLGDEEEAVAAYQRALKIMQRLGDQPGELEVRIGLGQVYANYHRAQPAALHSEQALLLARALQDQSYQALCLANSVRIRSAAYGHITETAADTEEALRLAEAVTDPKLLAEILSSLGQVLQWRGDFDRSLIYLRQGLAAAQQAHAGLQFGRAASNIGHALTSRGAYEEALQWYQQISDYASAAGDRFWLARMPNTIAGVYLELYNLEDALPYSLEGYAVAQQFDPWPEPWLHALLKIGLVHLQRQEYGDAQTYFSRAEALLEEDAWMRWRVHMALLRGQGELACIHGQYDEAWRYATQSLELATQTASHKHQARAKILQGDVLAADGRFDEAAHTLDTAVRLAEELGTPREVWLGKSSLGKVLMRLNRDDEAEAQLTQAAQTIEAIAGDLRTRRLHDSFFNAAPVVELYDTLGRRPPPMTA